MCAGVRRPLGRASTQVTAALLSGVLALATAACTRDDAAEREAAPQASATPADQETAPRAVLARRWPLTGTTSRRAIPNRRAVVVKIDNTAGSRPQIGLGKADLVVQQLVEGGLTRLAVFYHSRIPSDVGPVRSMRASDIGIVKPARGLLVASGGAPPTIHRMRAAGIPMATQGALGFHRVGGRVPLYGLFVDLDRLVRVRARGKPPAPYLPWSDADALRKGEPATMIDARFSGGTVNTWRYAERTKTYRRSINHTNGESDFKPDTVLVLRVKLTDAGYLDPAGNPVPETILAGRGRATLFHHGRAYEARWTKRAPGSRLRLKTRAGRPLRVPAGHTWIELVPNRGGDLDYRH